VVREGLHIGIAQFAAFTRGIGNEFAPEGDMSLPVGTKALFGNPEGGVGLIRGGGALAWLPRLVGRSRALGIVLSADHIDADIAERCGWVNRERLSLGTAGMIGIVRETSGGSLLRRVCDAFFSEQERCDGKP
jgi:1,4-dihydroxy-2-naphthoyl-CoA synthase